MTAIAASLAAMIILTLVHVGSGALRFLDQVPRSRWLSAAGGVAVSLVFLDILPELARGQETIARSLGPTTTFLTDHVYLVALAGLAVFYGMDRVVKSSRRRQRDAGAGDHTSDGVFWLSIAVVTGKNAIIGYLLVREPRSPVQLVLFTTAIGLELLVGDRGLHSDHKTRYDRVGRWLLAGALCFGWVIGYATELPSVAIVLLSAFLAGMIILNILKEELPEERETRYGSFLAGAAGYATLLLLV